MVLVLGNYNNPVYTWTDSPELDEVVVGVHPSHVLQQGGPQRELHHWPGNRFLKPKCTANVCTRMSFILKKTNKVNNWTRDRYGLLQEQSLVDSLSLEFMADSSMTSRRFSLIVISIELNFCLTCLSGRLGEKTIKKIFSTTKSDRTNQIIKQP